MSKEKQEDLKADLNYTAIHVSQIIAGFLFFSVGVIFLLVYDYGLLSFLFAIPQFFLTGFIPLLMALLILFRGFLEAESVSLSSDDKALTIEVSWIKSFRNKKIRHKKKVVEWNSLRYIGLKYRETRTKRWLIIALLMTFTIEVLLQNAVDLFGHARIAPYLLIGTIITLIGIVLFIFSPRRYIEIGSDKEILFIPYKNLSPKETQLLLSLFKINNNYIKNDLKGSKMKRNITLQLSNFIIGISLIALGILLCITPLFFLGSFTRIIALILGMKIVLRVLNGDPYYMPFKDDKNFLIGDSLKLTFMKMVEPKLEKKRSFSPARFHVLEISCIFYLIFQAVKYAFRFLWWGQFAGFDLVYFLLGIGIIFMLFIRWFNPINIINVEFKEFSMRIHQSESIKPREGGDGLKLKVKNYFSNFKSLLNNRELMISLIIFMGFIAFAFLYNLFGGNFLVL